MTRVPQILILTDDATRARRWSEALGDGMRVWQTVRDMPPETVPDVVVLDAVDAAASSGKNRQNELGRQDWPVGEIGIVAVGDDPAAEVCLPPDITPRELQLACRLLSETARWRRECHRARQLQATYSQQALTDALTGLPNRRAWEAETRDRSASLASNRGSICLALFDVDHFKLINDRFGHIAGDEILCHVGRGLVRACRESDFVARMGGDEFVLLLDGRSPEEAAADIESIRGAACRQTPHTQVTACMGFAYVQAMPPTGLTPLLESADVALRVAKLSGRNQTVPAKQTS